MTAAMNDTISTIVKIRRNKGPPAAAITSKPALSRSLNELPGCTSDIKKLMTRKIAPPAAAASTVARGMLCVGLWVSSDRVVTASKPRKEYAAIAAPAAIALMLVAGLTNGASDHAPTGWSPAPRKATQSPAKTAMTRSCAVMIVRFTRSAIWMPRMLITLVQVATNKTQTRNEIPGSTTSNALAVNRQITMGMNR